MGTGLIVVQAGDYMTAIAYRYGTTVQDLLADPSNAALKTSRPNPEILAPLDLVRVPLSAPNLISLNMGTTNSFTSTPPTVKVNVVLSADDGTPLAGKAVTTDPPIGDAPLSTDGSGLLTLDVSVLQKTVDVTVTETGESFCIRVGYLDPESTDTGILSRLRHMGHVGTDSAFALRRPDLMALDLDLDSLSLPPAVQSFQAANGKDETGVLDDALRADIRDAHRS
jgi:hypothetical protein